MKAMPEAVKIFCAWLEMKLGDFLKGTLCIVEHDAARAQDGALSKVWFLR
jgi:hypothetical protein